MAFNYAPICYSEFKREVEGAATRLRLLLLETIWVPHISILSYGSILLDVTSYFSTSYNQVICFLDFTIHALCFLDFTIFKSISGCPIQAWVWLELGTNPLTFKGDSQCLVLLLNSLTHLPTNGRATRNLCLDGQSPNAPTSRPTERSADRLPSPEPTSATTIRR